MSHQIENQADQDEYRHNDKEDVSELVKRRLAWKLALAVSDCPMQQAEYRRCTNQEKNDCNHGLN